MEHLLAISDLTRASIERLLDDASAMSAANASARGERADAASFASGRPARELEGSVIANLFLEPSTRTRVSFEVAAKRLGADVVNIAAQQSSVVKGETLLDTARTLDAMGPDVLVIRHAFAGAAQYLSTRIRASVVNAGDGQHEHPTQALLDAYTIRKAKGTLARRVIAIVGDIRHSRVARSGIQCFTKLGANVRVCGPATLIPPGIEKLGCTVVQGVENAVRGADVVMCLRVQNERMVEAFVPSTREYATGWRINAERLALAKPDAIVMHPGPMNRGVEITSEVADSAQSMIENQVEHGVLVRMAVLRALVQNRKRVPTSAPMRRVGVAL